MGRPLREVRSNGQVLALAGIDTLGNLLYYTTHVGNSQAAVSIGTASLYAGGSLGLNLSGSSASVQNKLGIWDGGAVRATHVELTGRITQVDKASTVASDEEHPTHVATTMIGAGVNPQARGMAYGAKLQAWDFNSDVSEMTTAAPNLLVSNHSYGITAGFQYNPDLTGSTQWEWYGDTTISKTYDYKFGLYATDTRNWDQVANNAPYYLIVKSAGNDHGSYPGDGQPYILVNHNKRVSTAPRDNQSGYDQLSTSSNAKNILTVGAISNLSNGYNVPADVKLAEFSSWGPTDDGRIKPDLVSIGVSLFSAYAASDSAYESLSGTSMASPTVSGSMLLLQEYYAQLNPGKYMRSSTLRGLAIHTTNEAGDTPGPDYKYGWGMLNTEKAARVIGNSDKSHLLSERTLAQGQRDTVRVVASGRGPLVVTICWNDPAGTATSTLNDRTPRLVNDLDVRVSDGKTTTQPWILDPNNPANAASSGDNIRDNIEQIRIDNAVPGQAYTVAISHKSTLRNNQQDYALIVSGIGGVTYCTSAPASTADTKISRVQFGSINQAGADGCTSYSDFTKTTTTVQASQVLPLTVSLGTCGAQKNAVVKVFADWSANGNFTDTGETLATSGVLNNTGQFTANITIPASVTVGQLIRLRIVASETSDPTSVSPCGAYGNGETQDYVLNVVQISNDVSAVALLSPEANFCGQTNSQIDVSVRVRNYGSATQTNVPVTIKIIDATNTTISTLTGTVPTLAPFSDAVLTVTTSAGITLASGQAYQFVISTNLSTDQNAANNTVTETRTTATAITGLFTATRCGSDTLISLRNTGGGTAFWYNAPTGGNLLAAGNQTSVKATPATGLFYATLNDFSGTIGPVDKKVFGGGSYSGNFGPSPLISTAVPLTIESARLYIGTAGQLTFTVRKYDNTVVSSVTLDVTPTRNQSLTATVNSQLVDDPNDQGAVYPLHLQIPQAGDYKITIDYGNGASIFRSNVSVSGFPYQLKTQSGTPIVTIKGSLYARTSTVTDTLTDAWYYLYNLKVRSLDCPSPQRTAVAPATGTGATATITPNGSTSVCQGASVTLQANTGDGLSYQWYLNNQAITGATSSTLQAATAGNYIVQVANSCLPVRSSAVTLTVKTAQTPSITINSYILTTDAVSNIQWLLDGIAISGAAGASYSATKTGRYSVKGSVNGCGELISQEVYLTILANEPVALDGTLNVFPNPATQQVTVLLSSSTSLQGTPTLRLTDLRGLTIQTATLQRDGKTYSAILDVTSLPGGAFFVVIEDDKAQRIGVRQIRKQ
ncbi:S8 family serine peptidase [Spirosoma sp. KNUC1025]|uniref:S8 family serine peptidase n=1 Tax=Spirosoma sp. KNUC1025 TaxID=2894082 RepID=UPI0038630575|nr:S8 family serine peptidase [Spirosoma sp. KNUC1025]